jgi:hypothetical protein
MQKASLQPNILPKAKNRFAPQDLPATLIHLTRDPIPMEVGVINLADQTRVPGGRKRSGDFTVEIQFARDEDRLAYYNWFKMAIDVPGENGINPSYKRSAKLTYYRLFTGTGGTFDASSDLKPVKVSLTGCWVSKMELPGGDIEADNGNDGDTKVKITINFDDATLD